MFGLGTTFDAWQNRVAAKKASRKDWEHYKNRISVTVADAKRAGIHPLAALGMGSSSPPPTRIAESGFGKGLSELATDVTKLVSSDEKELGRIRLEQEKTKLNQMKLEFTADTEAYNENKRVKTLNLGESEVDKAYNLPGQGNGTAQGAGSGGTETGPGINLRNPEQVRTGPHRGLPRGISPFERKKQTKEGKVVFTPLDSQDIEENLNVKVPYYGQRVIEVMHSWLDALRGSKTVKNRIRAMLPKARPGYFWEWRAGQAAFYEVKRVQKHRKRIPGATGKYKQYPGAP